MSRSRPDHPASRPADRDGDEPPEPSGPVPAGGTGRVLVAVVALLTVTATLPGGAVALAAPAPGNPVATTAQPPGDPVATTVRAPANGIATTAQPPGDPIPGQSSGPALAADPGPIPGGTVTDGTGNRSFAGGYHLVVANATYADPGTVTNVTVDLAGGADGDVPAADVDSVVVRLVNASRGVVREAEAASYDAHGTSLAFDDGGPDVDRVLVYAHVAEGVADGVRIDAAYTISNGTATTSYDTGGVQTARTDDAGFVVGTVLDQDGDPVENATVRVVDLDAGDPVLTLSTDENGEFGPRRVVSNRNYTVDARKFGYVTDGFAREVFVDPGETESIPATLELHLAADALTIAPADLGDPNTTDDDRLLDERVVLPADGRSSTKATFVAVVENSSAESPGGEGASLFAVDVTLEFANGTGVGDFLDNDRIDREITVRTTRVGDVDGDGYLEAYAPFAVTADAANASSMDAAAVTETIRGSFVNALGERIVSVGVDGGDATNFETESTDDPPAPSFSASDLAAPANASPGETVAVSATVTEGNGTAGETTIAVRLDADGDGTLAADETLATRTVSLDGGESERVTLDATVPDLRDGDYRLGVVAGDGTATGTITVAADTVVDEYDANGDGDVDTGELNAAIRDWATGAITTEQLNAVVEAWASS